LLKEVREKMKKAFLLSYLFSSGFKKKRSRPFGVNLIGPVRGDYGLGESCRILADVLKAGEVPFTILHTRLSKRVPETNRSKSSFESLKLPYSINLMHINSSQLAAVLFRYGRKIDLSNYNIGYLLWELPEFPQEELYTLDVYDEIWTPSEYLTSIFRSYTSKPVYTMRYGLSVPETSRAYDRKYFGLPEEIFLFLFSYDGTSNSERKNPTEVLQAYKRAFSKDRNDVGLVIKASHTTEEERERIKTEMQGYENVFVLSESMKKVEFNSLLKNADVFVSLHRAEGFGLVPAEAMLLGTPVIATNWSANSEFMNSEVACPVPARIVELDRDYPPYKKGYHWADPDVSAAADYMVKLVSDRSYYDEIAANAQKYITQKFDVNRAGTEMRGRIGEIAREQEEKRIEDTD